MSTTTFMKPGITQHGVTGMVDASSPLVVKGKNGMLVEFPTQERADRARDYVAEFAAKGKAPALCEPAAARGVKAPSRPKGGSRKSVEPISTGDAKFDMYLNALPPPVRQLVIPNQLDPRAIYKEYRKLGKADLVAAYTAKVAAGELKAGV